jgi:hypothetical protein
MAEEVGLEGKIATSGAEPNGWTEGPPLEEERKFL